jgi:hypothetical protein
MIAESSGVKANPGYTPKPQINAERIENRGEKESKKRVQGESRREGA